MFLSTELNRGGSSSGKTSCTAWKRKPSTIKNLKKIGTSTGQVLWYSCPTTTMPLNECKFLAEIFARPYWKSYPVLHPYKQLFRALRSIFSNLLQARVILRHAKILALEGIEPLTMSMMCMVVFRDEYEGISFGNSVRKLSDWNSRTTHALTLSKNFSLGRDRTLHHVDDVYRCFSWCVRASLVT